MINEISAELFLNRFYPDKDDKWIVRNKGSFFRNYNSDVMEIRMDEDAVFLARDGFLRLLPDEVLSEENELSDPSKKTNLETWEKKEKRNALLARLELLAEAFVPIDTLAFRQHLKLEKKVTEILDDKTKNIMKRYYGFDLDKEQDPWIRKAALLLPYTVKTRGNLKFVKALLEEITRCKVEIRQSDFSEKDNTRYWLPMLHFDVIMDDLTTEEYTKEDQRLQPLAQFLIEYFLPFEVITEIHVKSRKKNGSMLDYNTTI